MANLAAAGFGTRLRVVSWLIANRAAFEARARGNVVIACTAVTTRHKFSLSSLDSKFSRRGDGLSLLISPFL